MFWDNFVKLCNQKNQSPNGVCSELNLSNATATKWKSGAIPRDTTLKKIADYFGVTVGYLLGSEEKEKSSPAEPELSEGEKALIELFRHIPEEQQKVFLEMGRVYADSLKKDRT